MQSVLFPWLCPGRRPLCPRRALLCKCLTLGSETLLPSERVCGASLCLLEFWVINSGLGLVLAGGLGEEERPPLASSPRAGGRQAVELTMYRPFQMRAGTTCCGEREDGCGICFLSKGKACTDPFRCDRGIDSHMPETGAECKG